MGWTFTEKPREGAKAYLDSQFTWQSDNSRVRVIESAFLNLSEYYAAVEVIDATGARYVFAVVCMVRYCAGHYGFGYKDMDETAGPVIKNCPARILDLLTEPANQWAADWRAACRANLAQAAAVNAMRPGSFFRYGGDLFRLEKKTRAGIIARAIFDYGEGDRYRFTRGARAGIVPVIPGVES